MRARIGDGRRFLPHVLRHPEFNAHGILFGADRRLGAWMHWVVIDPGRHVFRVWRRTSTSYVEDALRMDASAFSNGPFADYADGSLKRTTVHLGADLLRSAVLSRRIDWRDMKVRHYEAAAPHGYVIGTTAGVRECRVARPRLHYFGRGPGASFGDYEIAKGDPQGVTEAIGGLFRVVEDFRPYTISRRVRTGFWGLAPLVSSPVLAQSDVTSALAGYADPPTGLVVGLAGWGNTRRLARMLAAIGVKDAVQIDGSNSLLFGGRGRVLIGRRMPGRKQLLQRWGLCFASLPPR